MDLTQIATKLFMDKIGGSVDTGTASKALSQLIGSGDSLDIAGLVTQFTGSGLAGAAKSWLGDGPNEAVSADQITEGFGASAVSSFASQLGVSPEDAASGLAAAIPNLVDQSSKGGSLLGSLGGLGGIASKLLG